MLGIQDIKQLPHNSEAERFLLACIFLDEGIIPICNERLLLPSDFFHDPHKHIYESIQRVSSKGQSINNITIGEDLKKKNLLSASGGDSFLFSLMTELLSPDGYDSYINIIQETSTQRQVLKMSQDIAGLVYDGQDITDILGAAEFLIDNMRARHSSNKDFIPVSQREHKERAFEELMATDPDKILKWGRKEWDDNLGGIYGGNIYAVGANTGVGKTTFVGQLIKNISAQGKRVVVYSLEDRMENVGKRDLFQEVNKLRTLRGKEPYRWFKFINNEYSKTDDAEEFETNLLEAKEILSKYNITHLDKKKPISIDNLAPLMIQECERGADAIFIDHLHYFQFKEKQRLDLEITDIMQRINDIAIMYNVPIFLVSHYNRSANDEVPKLTDFKDASAITQVAAYTIQLTREYDSNEVTFTFIKARLGREERELEAIYNTTTGEYQFTKSEGIKNMEKEMYEDII